MRVAELVGVRQFRLSQGSIDGPGAGQVQVRVEAVGICGSDLHAYSEGSIGDTACSYPMVLGHEPAGVVTQVGAGVTGVSLGDLVACEPALFCYHCELCLAGRHNLCRNLRFLSTPGEPGFFRERVNLPVENVVGLPKGFSVEVAALVEPLAVVLHSLRLAGSCLGETVAVFGAGPIGLLTVAALKHAGAKRIHVVEPVSERRALARALGADAVLDVDDPVRMITSDTGGRGVDLVFDCAATGDTANQCLAVARAGGRVVYTGIPSALRVPMDFHRWRRKELALIQVRRANREDGAARDLLAGSPAAFAPIVTHTRPMDEIGAAFALVESRADGVAKLVVRP